MSLISHEACKELEDYLLARLRKGNASAKHKCLQIMKHVCRAGRADFKRDLQRQAEVGGWVGGWVGSTLLHMAIYYVHV